jgi:hypothetical protein
MLDDDTIKSHPFIVSVLITVLIISVFFTFYIMSQEDNTNQNNYSQDFVEKVTMVASYYDGETNFGDRRVMNTVERINSTYDCGSLVNMFERNSGWTARYLLADKIVNTCL